MLGKLKKKHLISVPLLIIMTLLTTHANAYIFASSIQLPQVTTNRQTQTIEVSGMKFNLQEYSEITVFSNQSKLVQLSIMIENVSAMTQKIRINMTKMVEPESESSNMLAAQSNPNAFYTGPIITYPWDGIEFLTAPGNGSMKVNYDHDNNYWNPALHPGEWYSSWDIWGINRLHSHIDEPTITKWVNDEISNAAVWNKIATLGGSFAGALLGGIIAMYLKQPTMLAAVLSAIAAVLGAALNYLLELLGLIPSKAQWIRDNVQAAFGDGWTWLYNFHTTFSDASMLEGPYNPVPYCEGKIRYVMTLLTYDVREFSQNWGAERLQSPNTYSVELWNVVHLRFAE